MVPLQDAGSARAHCHSPVAASSPPLSCWEKVLCGGSNRQEHLPRALGSDIKNVYTEGALKYDPVGEVTSPRSPSCCLLILPMTGGGIQRARAPLTHLISTQRALGVGKQRVINRQPLLYRELCLLSSAGVAAPRPGCCGQGWAAA